MAIKAVVAVQMIHLGWEATNVPPSGLTDITFPIAMPKAPHEMDYYFEQAIAFQHAPENRVIYTGLQPRPNRKGKSIVHATFSSFFNNTTTEDKHCSYGADGGPGVSCHIDVEATYNTLYHLRIDRLDHTYNGTLIDAFNASKSWHIGSFTLPASVSGMKGYNWVGFMEYFWTNLTYCPKYPYTAATFKPPLTSLPGVRTKLFPPYRDVHCEGMPWAMKEPVPGTYDITINPNKAPKST
ncbi:hypothetical protein AAL_07961 [Moelleriella libera RCEF 2490]|uniref:Uncharacterized protein n=1 Tax=Moelleriella libera RCEF 2490 TaxID=1081109 RepID=A0A166NAT2_9HYPO|nr:hypothetical protein AAL_07961 [Moelleriella libera RCEF 2490]